LNPIRRPRSFVKKDRAPVISSEGEVCEFLDQPFGVALLAALLWSAPLYAADVGSVRGVVPRSATPILSRMPV